MSAEVKQVATINVAVFDDGVVTQKIGYNDMAGKCEKIEVRPVPAAMAEAIIGDIGAFAPVGHAVHPDVLAAKEAADQAAEEEAAKINEENQARAEAGEGFRVPISTERAPLGPRPVAAKVVHNPDGTQRMQTQAELEADIAKYDRDVVAQADPAGYYPYGQPVGLTPDGNPVGIRPEGEIIRGPDGEARVATPDWQHDVARNPDGTLRPKTQAELDAEGSPIGGVPPPVKVN